MNRPKKRARVVLSAGDGVDHGLAHASGFYPSTVRRIMRQLDRTDDGLLSRAEFRGMGAIMGESWDQERTAREFKKADTGNDGRIGYDALYRWLVWHARCSAGRVERHQPVSPLGSIPPQHLALFDELDLGVSHREDIIAPRRKVSLASHLVSVYTILKEWGAPEPVCTAGLFHSVYETAAGHRSCDVAATRPRLRAVLGAEVEELIYLFPAANQCDTITRDGDGLWDAPEGAPFRVPGLLRQQPDMIECPAALRAPLVLLYWANDIDQTPPWERAETLNFAAWPKQLRRLRRPREGGEEQVATARAGGGATRV